METYKYINKTVFYLKEAEDGFCYLTSLTVHAVSENMLYDKEFSKCVAVDSIFENYKDAKEYMEALGIEVYISDKKLGFRKIYKTGTDSVLQGVRQ